ncbi:MAG TPA: c-type cytochrome [Steroidobacteraceae bacterium]|nr:c-type cytochrome [Steroidobacteraceae bacterium]
MNQNCLIGLIVGATIYIGGTAWGAAENPAPDSPLGRTVQTCGTCHGTNGRSVSPTFPNLAAQTAPYIEAQLKAFKDQTRADPDAQAYMWGMAAQLSDPQISELADYFSKQPAPPPGKSAGPAMIARGRQVFEEGVPARQIPPCASCHGAHAEGMATFPRLAGQHAPYLLKQILVIQNALRNAPVMHGVAKELTKEQIQAVAAYLESI